MEIMTKEEYFKAIAEAFIEQYKTLSLAVSKLTQDEEEAQRSVSDEINEIYPCHGDEQMYLYDAKLDEAYQEYVEQNEPEHEFAVSFSISATGCVTVIAKDEDEAEDYINNCMSVDCNGDTAMVNLDTDKVVGDVNLDDWSGVWDLRDITDEGEVEE